MTSRLCLLLFCWMAFPNPLAAAPFVERLWPPVWQRGQTVRVEFSGSELHEPVGVWTSVPGTTLTGRPTGMASENATSLEISIPAEAPLGIYGVRLATTSGLSNVHLFLIDELTPLLLTRSSPETIPELPLPACLVAPVRKANVDRYALNLTAAKRLSFEVIGNRLGKNFDPVVTLRSAQGKFLAQVDNSQGLMFDCRFSHDFTEAGKYLVEVADGRFAGDPAWSYVLRVGEFPEVRTAVPAAVSPDDETGIRFPQLAARNELFAVRSRPQEAAFFQDIRFSPQTPATWIPLISSRRPVVLEQEPNDGWKTATHAASPISVSAELCGVLHQPGDEDWFQFPLGKGQSVRVRSETQAIGSAADLEIILYEPTTDAQGFREVVRNDETTTFESTRNSTLVDDANLAFTARTDGLHRLQIRDLTGAGSSAHTYRVELNDNGPELRLKCDVSEIAVPRGTWQPIPLAVTRTGFSGPVELEFLGAPAGVSLEPLVIPADAKEFVCRLSAAPDAPEAIATLQLVGRAMVNEQAIAAVATVHPLIDRQLVNKDRILYALRPEQRFLPPSLPARIALQVTGPIPFDFDLPDQQVLMPKYQTAPISIATQRAAEWTSPILFSARGGQIGDEREERVQVFFQAPPATREMPQVVGVFANRILTQYQQHRVDVTGTASVGGRVVHLTRTFQLEIRSAFQPKFEPAEIELLPGESATVKLVANRVSTFDGPVELLALNHPVSRIAPETLTLSTRQVELPVQISVKADMNPGRYQFQYDAQGYVGKFQETIRAGVLTVNVKKPDAKK